MNKYLLLIFLALFLISCKIHIKSGPDSISDELINITSLKANMEFLGADELEGREAGTNGEKVASMFIASELKKYGLVPYSDNTDYFQNFNLRVIRFSDQSTLSLVDEQGEKLHDFEYGKNFSGSTRYFDELDKTANVVFVGYGITADEYNYDDYRDLNVKDKIVLIYPGEPESDDTTFFEGKKRTTYTSLYKKIDNASKRGVLAVIALSGVEKQFGWESIVSKAKKGKFQLKDQSIVSSSNSLPYITINEQTFNEILSFSSYSYQDIENRLEEHKGLPIFEINYLTKINWMFDTTGTVETRNVVGIIEGRDPVLKHEYIGVGAHYDHIGVGMAGIYNGADDNASGTVALLEIARVFAERKENKRSILISFHTAEEKGSLGSKYLVEDSTILKNMNLHLNMDMIGRGSTDSIYCLGSDKLSSELYEFVETENSKGVNIYLDYRLNDPNDPQRFYYRSDHYSYAKKNIPSVFFFDKEMEDYHRVTDDVIKINFPKIQRISQLVHDLALSAANRESKFKLDL
jgi:hypothetical protein